jgi:hypothetical protein
VVPRPPARHALFAKAIEFVERATADAAEGPPRPPDGGVELRAERRQPQGRPTGFPPQFVANASLRLRGHIEHQPLEPPSMRMPEKDEVRSPRIQHTRLRSMPRQSEPLHHAVQPRDFAVGPSGGEHHEVLGLAHESSTPLAPLHMEADGSVEQMQVHIREQRRNQ